MLVVEALALIEVAVSVAGVVEVERRTVIPATSTGRVVPASTRNELSETRSANKKAPTRAVGTPIAILKRKALARLRFFTLARLEPCE